MENVLVDIMQEVVNAVKTELALPVLNYQFGYVEELDETLLQWNKSPEHSNLTFPLVYLRQPFTIVEGPQGYLGTVNDAALFVINSSTVNWKAAERMEFNFKPVINPIAAALIRQLNAHAGVGYEYVRRLETTDYYFWGENEKSVLNQIVDTKVIKNIAIKLNYVEDCIPRLDFDIPFKNF